MQVENHKEEVPFAHYTEKFKALDPAEAVSRLGDVYRDGRFYVNLLGISYAISHPDYAINPTDGGKMPDLHTQTFLLRYLLEGKNAPWQGSWLTFREMPWGELYITPYTGRVLKRAAFTFGTRLEKFKAAAEKLGGLRLSQSDAGYEFEFLPNLRIRVLVWEGDEEFPPSAQVLYSDNFAAFAAEDRVVAGDILISALQANM